MKNPEIKYDYFYWDDALRKWQGLIPVRLEADKTLYENIPANGLFMRQATVRSGTIYRRLGVLRNQKFIFYM